MATINLGPITPAGERPGDDRRAAERDLRGRRVLAPTTVDVTRRSRPRFQDYPGAVHIGGTPHFDVFYDGSLDDRGLVLATTVLQRAEADLAAVRSFFPDTPLPAEPFSVVLALLPEDERAYRYGADGLDLFCDVQTTPRTDPQYSSFLLTALLVEVLADARGRGWRSDTSSGEALSRVLAGAVYPRQAALFSTAAVWLDGSRRDYVNIDRDTDRDSSATGCAALFLHFLHHQLGHSWAAIVAAGGATLADTYRALHDTEQDPFPAFAHLLGLAFPPLIPARLREDNPFPLESTGHGRAKPNRVPAALRPRTVRAVPAGPPATAVASAQAGPPAAQVRTDRPTQPPAPMAAQPAQPARASAPADEPDPPGPSPTGSAPVAFDPVDPGVTGVQSGDGRTGTPGTLQTLEGILDNRRWLKCNSPFVHIRAGNVFTPEVYAAMETQYLEYQTKGMVTSSIPSYDVTATAVTRRNAGGLSVLTSRAWHDALAGAFGIEATGNVNVTLHHHDKGSESGKPHNDLNPGWFVTDDADEQGITVHDPQFIDYNKGKAAAGHDTVEDIRAIALIFYLCSPPVRSGGETGLYWSVQDPVDKPAVSVHPHNNSFIAFECTPYSFHSFITNTQAERNCIVMWLHRTKQETIRRFGEDQIVYW